MPVQITIIGLGQIGASLGLALGAYPDKITRTGSDIQPGQMQLAKKKGAVDKTAFNLNAAVRNADLIVAAVPQDQLQDLVTAIAPELKEGAVLMDTCPVKVETAAWITAQLPEGRYYIGLTPILNPNYLLETNFGLEAARKDLFENGLFGIISPRGTNPKAVDLAADLAALVGAAPFFSDAHEIDGLMASTRILPQLLSVALLNATLDQPGWAEARKVAGRAFAEVTGPAAHLDDVEALAAAALANSANVTRTLDQAIQALQILRAQIDAGNTEALTRRIQHARVGVTAWWRQRQSGAQANGRSISAELPPNREMMGNILGFGVRRKKNRSQNRE